jgi:IS66 C-terminal element
LNDVDPQPYFTDVLAKLVNLWPASRIDELMPRGLGSRTQQARRVTSSFGYKIKPPPWEQKAAYFSALTRLN